MMFRCVNKTTLNGKPVAVGTVISSDADLRCYSKDWVLVEEHVSNQATVEPQVIRPRVTRIKK